MKHSTRYLLPFLLLTTLLIFLLLASNSATYATQAQIEQVLATITLTRTSTPDGRPMEVAQVIAAASNTPTRTPTPINIGDFVWDDVDHDGRQDDGEPGMAGVTVQLWNSAKTQLLDSAVTNASGRYTVTAPLPGDYRIRVLLPSPSDQFSPKDMAGGNNQLDSDINPSGTNLGFTDIFNLANNVISTTVMDAGIQIYRTPTPTRTPTPINVGNFVWNDLDGDGVQDMSEPGLGGITVQLWNSSKTQLIDSTTTNASGLYTLIAPLPGDYRVRVVRPTTSDQFTIKDSASATDQSDSDINPTGINLGFTDVYTFASNLISITTIDAGLSVVQLTPTPSNTPTATPTPHPPNASPLRNFTNNYIVEVSWSGVTWAAGYTLQVDNNANFSSPEYSLPNIAASERSTFALLPYTDALYYWRVGAKDAGGTIRWSTVETFTVNIP